jgi:hypothetical protein
MSINPQINASNYILNIVELQNVVTNASGLSPLEVLSNTVNNLQEMVNYDLKRINVNTIAKFNQTPIQVIDDINLSNVSLYQNGNLFVGGGTSAQAPGTVSLGSTSILLNSTVTTESGTYVSFDVNGSTAFAITSNTNVVASNTFVIANSSGGLGKSLMCIDTLGTSVWGNVSTLATADTIRFLGSAGEVGRFTSASNFGIGTTSPTANLDVVGDGNFTGRVSAFDFLTLSDRRYKANISRIENGQDILNKISGVRFMWRDISSNDVGVIAQDLLEVLPEAVASTNTTKLSVAYHKIIPVLVEVIKELQARVEVLERKVQVEVQ